jgi:hypothetical protein
MEIQKKVSYTTFGDEKGKQYSSKYEACDNPCEPIFCETKAQNRGCAGIPTCEPYKKAKLAEPVVLGVKNGIHGLC